MGPEICENEEFLSAIKQFHLDVDNFSNAVCRFFLLFEKHDFREEWCQTLLQGEH